MCLLDRINQPARRHPYGSITSTKRATYWGEAASNDALREIFHEYDGAHAFTDP